SPHALAPGAGILVVMRRLLACGLIVACSSPPPKTPSPPAAVLEGRVIDARTRQGLSGVDVLISTPCGGNEVLMLVTDEHGSYRADVSPGPCEVSAMLGNAEAEHALAIAVGSNRLPDLELDHDLVLAARQADPPVRCPSSSQDAVVRGHSTS